MVWDTGHLPNTLRWIQKCDLSHLRLMLFWAARGLLFISYSGSVRSPFNSGYVMINSVQLAAFTKCDLCFSCGANWRKICIRSISEGIEAAPWCDAVFLGAGCINQRNRPSQFIS